MLRSSATNTVFSSKSLALISKGAGCPACKESKGERAVRRFLIANDIAIEAQSRLIDGTGYSFDFRLLDRPVLVEFHGEQHYKPVDFSSRNQERADKQFKIRQRRDRFKSRWAKHNGYRLIVIPYWKSVEDVLSEELNLPLAKAA